MKTRIQKESGFTAVELLITLFIAVAFLVAGYSMSALVVNDSGDARAQVKASGLAEEYLDRYSTTTGTCSASTLVNNLSETVDGLSNVTVTVTKSCPNSYVTRLSLIEVTVLYNQPQKTLKLSTYSAGQ